MTRTRAKEEEKERDKLRSEKKKLAKAFYTGENVARRRNLPLPSSLGKIRLRDDDASSYGTVASH